MLLFVAACGDAIEPVKELAITDSVFVREPVRVASDVEFFRALTVEPWEQRAIVLDGGNRRIVRLTDNLAFDGAVGSEGAGPGEFKFALDMSVRGDTVAIGDIGNSRILFLDVTTGREVRTLATPTSPLSLAMLPDGTALIPLADPQFYLLRVRADGPNARFAPRPDTVTAPSRDVMVRVCGTNVYVLDPGRLMLLHYSTAGELVRTYPLPPALSQRLVRRRDEVLAAFTKQGARVQGYTPIKALTLLNCTQPLLLFVDDELFGLVIDVERQRARALPLPQDPVQRETLRNAGGIAVVNSRFLVLRDDELWSYAFD